MTSVPSLEDLARRAVGGDREALDALVPTLQRDVYGLALRMLWNREDAEDATQEILVRVATRLSRFQFRSRLTTWVYRVAVNYLLDVKKSPVERLELTFERFGEDLADGLSTEGPADAERSLLVEEVRVGCTLGMLQCLDRSHRLVYVLGEILGIPGPEGASVLGITPSVFRKRLQRARSALETFTRAHCGLVTDTAPCQCNRRVPAALQAGRVRGDRVDYARDASSFAEARAVVRRVDDARRALAVHRASQPRASSAEVAHRLAAALEVSGV